MNLKIELKNRLRDAKRVAILGIGSELRGDDAAGILVARYIGRAPSVTKKQGFLRVFEGATAPENLTGEIKKFKPTHLVIIDSADINEKVGVAKLIDPDKVSGFSSCTHSLPIKILVDYLAKSIGCEVAIIGIQPGRLDFASDISKEVKQTTRQVSKEIKDALCIYKEKS